ncbi:hypothetical protein HAZT_HAZT005347 [Hyalella azteca]|uniref:Neurotransmitter-gated ion-channel ligand-binding domain-containing protein n=1 Tax=Hyalella azteca TaxID=294128 RepID=A0A6A0H126_HYAAZ|nr:hypothetical protein HAZT_HAZT005347 [Hyalella azteca]
MTGTRADELEYRLTRYLMANYDPSVRPAHNSSEPLSVVFGLSLHSIIDVDEKNQILTTNCWLTQVWIDAHLIWNASDFGGISVIRVPYDKVWKPDIILYNNADAQYSASTINTNVIVKSNGEVTWLSHGIYRSSCEMNVEYFPFDVQSCKMKWSSLYYGVTICLVTLASALSVLTLNLHHRGLRGVEVPPLARKIILGWGAKFVLLNFKDSEAQAKAKLRSGGSRDTEKFQMHDLDPMEHMERFSHFDPFSVSPHFSPRHRLNHSSNDLIHAHSTGPTSPIMGTSAEMTEFEQQFLRVLRKVQQTIDKNETRLSDQDRREAIKDEWQRVSMVLDRALLLCFVLATSVATSCILLSSPHGP